MARPTRRRRRAVPLQQVMETEARDIQDELDTADSDEEASSKRRRVGVLQQPLPNSSDEDEPRTNLASSVPQEVI